MKVIIGKPPIYDEANKAFKLKNGVVFTYGEVIYNPDGVEIPPDLFIHEQTHGKQQKLNDTVAKLWWQRYLEDPQFRLEQEVEAYHEQYKFICKNVKDRNWQDRNLRIIARDLASPLYGLNITEQEAGRMIRNGKI